MLVSAIMPTGNRQQWAPLAIECFLQQTFTDAELLVVDDGIDPTPVPDHPRIRYVRLPAERKLLTGAKRNLCCEFAQGEIIVNWDDDDWYAPERIASQLEQLRQTHKALVGYHRISFWDTNPGALHRAYQYVGDKPYCSGTSQMYLKSWWSQFKFKDKSIGEDSDFSAEARRACQLASFEGDQTIVARAHSDSTCPPKLGKHYQFPKVSIEQIPAAFLRAIGVSELPLR